MNSIVMKAESTVTGLPAMEAQNKNFPILLNNFPSKTNEQISKKKFTSDAMLFCQSFMLKVVL